VGSAVVVAKYSILNTTVAKNLNKYHPEADVDEKGRGREEKPVPVVEAGGC
jgi:hypothetical protein